MPKSYAEILLPRKISGNSETLTYQIPEKIKNQIKPGILVEIPLRNKTSRGIVYKIHDKTPKFETKEIKNIINDFYDLSSWQLKLLEYVNKHYFSPKYKCLKLFYPSCIFTKKRHTLIAPPKERDIDVNSLHKLTSTQEKALKQIIENPKHTILLHGITSSGKTEIYKHLTKKNVLNGLQTLILVPEISLTPQTVRNFRQQFGNNIAVIHSKLTPSKKLDYLTNIARGNHKIIIGSRSAIFAPFKNLRTIIIDEEHEDSYKQEQSPGYHAREIAIKIKQFSTPTIQIILGSATPSMESYYNALQGKYHLVEMPKRIPNKNGKELPLPQLKIVDMREELRKRNFSIFSEELTEKLIQTIKKKEQAILFLNRRGAASAVLCRDCGHIEQCPNCSVALRYHFKKIIENTILPTQRLICHHCGSVFPLPSKCKNCNSHLIKQIGLGTQKIEEELQKLLPNAKILRADKDTTNFKNGFNEIYNTFRTKQADILIGTQMIGKGLHLPGVTLVGIVLAETGLAIPDFRSAEKTFQLLTQVSGRSGREKEGEVIIQTYIPEHYAITSTATQDYKLFYNREIKLRYENKLPPFRKIIKITTEAKSAEEAHLIASQLAEELDGYREIKPNMIEEINIFPALIPKLKNVYRWQILLNGNSPLEFLYDFSLKKTLPNGIKIDVNPIHIA